MEHRDWTEQDWAKVMFSDEAKFQLFGNYNTTVVSVLSTFCNAHRETSSISDGLGLLQR